ncbi:pyridoxine/pyridoxamine 5'-phosphate oxidase-like [Physella acuta]|uniref:pyridoxine/pyridoxamine 5'-phosphate oxidase-like n=1 Tax=Physella acuta TaxID=109671 RepID=UPI0027DE1368|nr:pyridoxine/pyridoxamine 5'-phosphate oxidase-like [Physella acuta]
MTTKPAGHEERETLAMDDVMSLEPFGQFQAWFEQAKSTEGMLDANLMSLATATRDGKPSVRIVLMKDFDKRGIVFYTIYGSRKTAELDDNNSVALLFYWCSCNDSLGRQVRVEGRIEKINEDDGTEYFHSRPRDAQIVAWASRQSQLIQNKKMLDERNLEQRMKYGDNELVIPKPEYWGGYRVIPNRFEFWQGQTNRLHDRIVFRRPLDGEQLNTDVTHAGVDGWVYERLMP